MNNEAILELISELKANVDYYQKESLRLRNEVAELREEIERMHKVRDDAVGIVRSDCKPLNTFELEPGKLLCAAPRIDGRCAVHGLSCPEEFARKA